MQNNLIMKEIVMLKINDFINLFFWLSNANDNFIKIIIIKIIIIKIKIIIKIIKW